MHAITIHAAKDLRLEAIENVAPGRGEVSVEIARGGICGSDLHYYQHGGFGTVRLREPMILGHEVSGFVRDVGEGVDGFTPGDLVAVSPSRPCGTCEYCVQALHNHCLNMRFYGSAMPMPHIQGAFRQLLVADTAQCVKANALTVEEAAMAEPLAVCLHAARRAGDLAGKRVLVTGSGPIGALCVAAARRGGAAEIVVTDVQDAPLAFARDMGADQTINSASEKDWTSHYSGGKGTFDVLFECSGVAAALRAAVPAVRARGIIVQVGMGGDAELPLQAITAKELDLRGTFRFHAEFAEAVEVMERKHIDVRPLLTAVKPLAEFQSAFDLAADKSQSMKVQIDFS